MNHRATQLWEIGKLLQLDNGYWVHRNPDLGYLLEDYPPECADRDQTWLPTTLTNYPPAPYR